MAWTGGAKWLAQILSWASTLIVARLLSPADYGIIGMAMVYLGLVELVNEFGIGSAVVQQRDLAAPDLAQLSGFSVALGCVWFLLSAAVAAPIAACFGEPAVRAVIIVLGSTFVAAGFRTMPVALMTRDMRFRLLAGLDGIEALVLAGATLTGAILGLGYWALVSGIVTSRVVGAVLAQVSQPQRMAWPLHPTRVTRTLQFGFHVLVSRIAWYVHSNADFAIVGRILGKASLGAYSIGWTIASIPVTRVHALYRRVMPAVFSAVQGSPSELSRHMQRLTEGIAIITIPACIGIALVADQFVLIVLGDHWRAAVTPLRILAVAAALRSLTPLLAQLLVGTGHAKENRNTMIAGAVVLPVLFYLGSRWGTTGVAWAWLVGHPLVIMTNQVRQALRITNTQLTEYLRALWPAVSSTAVMTVAVLAARALAVTALPQAAEFVASVAAGAAAYSTMIFVVHQERIKAFRLMLSRIRS
jgi:PST family polysaccharide transporter